ncbi:MAG: hypothetical protein PHQ23_09430 [Candidatus Wallbacteria bacterium]|nr:hypothetical protein [Candidatus Wallbacteria bacterium]
MKRTMGILLALLIAAFSLTAAGSIGIDQQIVLPSEGSDWQNDQLTAQEVSEAQIMQEAKQELSGDPDFQKFLQNRATLTDGQRIVLYYAGTILAHADVWGTGNADYWLRAWTNLRDEGIRNSNAMKKFTASVADPFLKSTIDRIASDIYTTSGGTGYVEYWLQKAENLENTLRKAGNKLLLIYNETANRTTKDGGLVIPDGHHGNPTNPSDPPVSGGSSDALHVVKYAGRVLYYVSVGGTGDVDYWYAASQLYHHEAGRHADLLAEIANYVTDSNLKLSVKMIATDLKLSNSGTGTVNFWLSRAESLGQNMRKYGDNLCRLAGI